MVDHAAVTRKIVRAHRPTAQRQVRSPVSLADPVERGGNTQVKDLKARSAGARATLWRTFQEVESELGMNANRVTVSVEARVRESSLRERMSRNIDNAVDVPDRDEPLVRAQPRSLPAGTRHSPAPAVASLRTSMRLPKRGFLSGAGRTRTGDCASEAPEDNRRCNPEQPADLAEVDHPTCTLHRRLSANVDSEA